MTDRMQFPESDPRHHSLKVKAMLDDLIEHIRSDVTKVEDARFKALFETTAEVATGLKAAYEHAEQGTEPGWK